MINRVIESPQNHRFKRWKKLLRKKGRLKEGCFLIEGWSLLEEAWRSALPVHAILHHPAQAGRVQKWREDRQLNIPCFSISEQLFAQLSTTEHSQGVLAEVKMPHYTADDLWLCKPHTHLLLDRVRDPGNLGTIFRSAEALGASALWLSPETVDPFNEKVVRSAMGSLFRLPFCTLDLQAVCEALEQRNIHLYVAAPRATQPLTQVAFPRQVAFLLGNEAHGVEPSLLRRGIPLQIPMVGPTESLNVAMTAGILLYERLKQRQNR